MSAQGREKINLIYTFTKMGHAILVSDVDTVWMQNPLPYMAKYPEADCLVSSDHLVIHSAVTSSCRCHSQSLSISSHALQVPYMASAGNIYVSSMMLLQRETVTDGGLELYPEAGSAANIGIMLVKPNAVPLAKVI